MTQPKETLITMWSLELHLKTYPMIGLARSAAPVKKISKEKDKPQKAVFPRSSLYGEPSFKTRRPPRFLHSFNSRGPAVAFAAAAWTFVSFGHGSDVFVPSATSDETKEDSLLCVLHISAVKYANNGRRTP